jgi:indole-3-glycerol phosphate synthase
MYLTSTILDDIIAAKRLRLDKTKAIKSFGQLELDMKNLNNSPALPFYDVLKKKGQYIKIIAEIKKASPSEGLFSENFSLENITSSYEGAKWIAAVSVLTEEEFFQGSIDNLQFVTSHNTQKKPVLRKDFIFDVYQIMESKCIGADAYLLIACLFNFEELRLLVNTGLELGIEPLVEVHTPQELEMVVKTNARCIGVNSRNLQTFKIDNRLHRLLETLDAGYVRIAESGIDSASYLIELGGFIDAALIGTYFMKSNNISDSLADLKVAKKGI